MRDDGLTFGGEFRDRARELAFNAWRLPETLRLCRLILIVSALMNTLFLISDWRFHGTAHFWVAVPARLFVVGASLAAYPVLRRAITFRQALSIMAVWQLCAAIGVAFLVSSRSDLALFVTLLLPTAYYLVIPGSFRQTVIGGSGCSALMLAGYLGNGPWPETLPGLLLVLVMLNIALALTVSYTNRLRRTEFSATQSERRARRTLEETQAMVERLFMAVPIPLVVASVEEGTILRGNDAGVRFFGRPGATGLGTATMADYVDRSQRKLFVERLARDGAVEDFETTIRDGQGRERTVVMTGASLPVDQNPAVLLAVADITEIRAQEAVARRQATHDQLTGLPNRRLFNRELETALRDEGSEVSLLLIDLDDFKSVNDTLGHDAGDRFLVDAVERLRTAVDPRDRLARLGGDEFCVLSLRPLGPEGALSYAAELLAALRDDALQGGARASVGIALSPVHHRDPIELMKDADLALYRAKALGRNRAMVYEPAMREAVNERVTQRRDITEALKQGRILPFFQPQLSLATGEVVGLEALARWRHAERGILPAAAFIGALEDNEIGVAVGEAIFAGTLDAMRGWALGGHPPVRCWINLTAGALRQPDHAARMLARMAEAGIAPERFGVEVTETVLLARHGGEIEKQLSILRAAGVSVALDDFGTGYASLTHLRRFPVDVVKLDKSFVAQIAQSSEDEAICRAMLRLSADLGLVAIAEGVETDEQEEALIRLGCPVVQGYRYARPSAASRVPWLLGRGLAARRGEDRGTAAA